MAYVFIKIITFVYLLGAAYLVLRAISHSIFSVDSFKVRMTFLLNSILVSIVWPLSAFSNTGRSFIARFAKL